MTDKEARELNEACAIKLGLEQLGDRWHRPNVNDENCCDDLPNYVGDVAACWEIAEKLRKTELFSLCWHDGYWHCEINVVDWKQGIDEEADTAPEAIVRAYLKLP